jgi:hypothetical protein
MAVKISSQGVLLTVHSCSFFTCFVFVDILCHNFLWISLSTKSFSICSNTVSRGRVFIISRITSLRPKSQPKQDFSKGNFLNVFFSRFCFGNVLQALRCVSLIKLGQRVHFSFPVTGRWLIVEIWRCSWNRRLITARCFSGIVWLKSRDSQHLNRKTTPKFSTTLQNSSKSSCSEMLVGYNVGDSRAPLREHQMAMRMCWWGSAYQVAHKFVEKFNLGLRRLNWLNWGLTSNMQVKPRFGKVWELESQSLHTKFNSR